MPQSGNLQASSKRVAIYTRYSCDMQRPATLEDQERNCREIAEQKGWVVLDEFVRGDAAKTGRVLNHRKGLEFLLAQAELNPRPFDVLIVDEMSRLSRKLRDILGIADTLRFYEVKLYIVSHKLDSDQEGFSMMVNLLGSIAEEHSKDMRRRVLRGQEGRVRDGYKSGGRCFGYRSVPVINTARPDLQGRAAIEGYEEVVYEPEAETIRRIFSRFSDGWSVSQIAHTLNREKVPGPRPSSIAPSRLAGWHESTVKRILKQEKYAGRRIWNKTTQIIHPVTGKTVTRKNEPQKWLTTEVPKIRIVSDELWARVRERLEIVNEKMTRHRIAAINRAKKRDYLFNGLLECGLCGSPMNISSSGPSYVCSSWRRQTGCSNRLWIKEERLTSQLIAGLTQNILIPEFLDHFADSVAREFEQYVKGSPHDDEDSFENLQERELTLKQSCQRVVEAMMDPISANSTFLPRQLAKLEAELAEVQVRKQLLDAPKSLDDAKLDFGAIVKSNVSSLLEAIREEAPKAREVLQRRIKKLRLIPTETDDGPAYQVLGEIDLFASLADSKKSVLVACSSTRTGQWYTDEVDYIFRFFGLALYPDLCVDPDPLVKPLADLLATDPGLLHAPKSAREWAELLKPHVQTGTKANKCLAKRGVTVRFRDAEDQFVRHFEMTTIDYRNKTWYMFSKAGSSEQLKPSDSLSSLRHQSAAQCA